MPIPSPSQGEKESEFIGRCISTLKHIDKERPDKQTQAICFSQWRRKESAGYLKCPQCGKAEAIPIYYSRDGTDVHVSDTPIFKQCLSCDYTWQEADQEQMHADFNRIQNTFIKRYGEEEGLTKFQRFISLNGLDTEKQYHPRIQYAESFQWIEPLITYYRMDGEAKYYKVTALTANISMNNNDYTDYEKMKRAAPSLSYRPVNMNHDHNRWLPFPRTRIDFSKADDLSVEAILRVDNEDKWLQKMLDEGVVIHPSIEGRPFPDGSDYYLSGMALLEKGVQLPGDPLTEISPLFLGESVGRKVCKIIDGMIFCNSDSGIVGESMIIESESKGEKNMTESEAKVELEEANTAPKADAIPKPSPIEDEKIILIERASALKDKKIAEQALLISEYDKKTHTLETKNIELTSATKSKDEELKGKDEIIHSKDETNTRLTSTLESTNVKVKETADALTQVTSQNAILDEKNGKLEKELVETKRIGREQMRLTEDGFATTKTRLEKEVQELSEKIGKLETKRLDGQKEILDLQHERNQMADREKKAVEEMLEARNEVAKTSEKFADLQGEVTNASKRINEANNKLVQESKEKQGYIEKLTQLEQNHNKTTNLLKQAIRKMAEDKQFFQDEATGEVLTDKDIQ